MSESPPSTPRKSEGLFGWFQHGEHNTTSPRNAEICASVFSSGSSTPDSALSPRASSTLSNRGSVASDRESANASSTPWGSWFQNCNKQVKKTKLQREWSQQNNFNLQTEPSSRILDSKS